MRRAWGIFALWGLALIFALVSGRDLAFNLLYFVTGVIAVALFWAWANQRGLLLKRATRTQRSQVGKYFEETLELINRSRWPKLWVEVHDDSDLPGHHVSRVVNSLGRGSTSRWQVRTLCRRRGRYALGPITLTSGDPLGIFRFTRALPDAVFLVITPATVDIPQFSPPIGYLPGGETMRRRTPYVTASVSGVRDYAPGDGFNRIHWPTTARTGRLISKEFELDPLADVWIFLDMYEYAHAETAGEEKISDVPLPWLTQRAEQLELPSSTVEYGVTIAASLAQHFLHADREVGFLSYAAAREVSSARPRRAPAQPPGRDSGGDPTGRARAHGPGAGDGRGDAGAAHHPDRDHLPPRMSGGSPRCAACGHAGCMVSACSWLHAPSAPRPSGNRFLPICRRAACRLIL